MAKGIVGGTTRARLARLPSRIELDIPETQIVPTTPGFRWAERIGEKPGVSTDCTAEEAVRKLRQLANMIEARFFDEPERPNVPGKTSGRRRVSPPPDGK